MEENVKVGVEAKRDQTQGGKVVVKTRDPKVASIDIGRDRSERLSVTRCQWEDYEKGGYISQPGIKTLIMEGPRNWAKKTGIQLPEPKDHPDIVVTFAFPLFRESTSGDYDNVLVEGINHMSALNVRGSSYEEQSEESRRERLSPADILREFKDPGIPMEIMICDEDRLGYCHFHIAEPEISPKEVERARHNTALLVRNPNAFVWLLNQKSSSGDVKVYHMTGDGIDPKAKAVFTLPNLSALRFDYIANDVSRITDRADDVSSGPCVSIPAPVTQVSTDTYAFNLDTVTFLPWPVG